MKLCFRPRRAVGFPRSFALACFLALATPIVAIAVAPTLGLGVIALSTAVERQAEAPPQAPNLPLEGRSKAAQPASGGGES